MKKGIFSVLSILFFALPLYSQFQNVRIDDNIMGESWISINPKNPNQMVTGVIGNFYQNSNISEYYCTSNAGLNWAGGQLPTTLGQTGGDPVVLVDTAGYFYYICVPNWMANESLTKLLCYKSTNGGMNWDNGITFGQVTDPRWDDMPMGCVDFSNTVYRNNIYVTWTLFDSTDCHNPLDSSYVYFSSSSNQGISFTPPKRVSMKAGHSFYDDSNPEGPVPFTGVNGEVYVCFPYDSLIMFNRSTDAGNTWLTNDITVSRQFGGYRAMNSTMNSPVITCDHSNSPYRGNVYIVYSDIRNGINDRDIWFTKSTNGGNSWSTVIRVNNDSPGHNQELPWICVDPITGYVWIAFYDSRNSSSQFYGDVYIARSTNGGSTFQNARVSNPSFPFGWHGEYMAFTAYNNIVRPVWTKYINSSRNELWTAIIDTIIGIQKISSEIPGSFTLSQNYPNPFNPSTKIKFALLKSGFTKISIYDELGREAAVLVNEELKAGSYETSWNAENFPSGIYFYKIESGDFSATKKMLMIK